MIIIFIIIALILFLRWRWYSKGVVYIDSNKISKNKEIICMGMGHRKIIINDIIDRNSRDRMCVKCGKKWQYNNQNELEISF